MSILRRIAFAFVLLALALFVIGWFVPSHYSVTRTISIHARPEQVFAYLDSPREWKKWGEWNRRDPAMTIQYAGPERGADAAWSWQSASQGNGSMIFNAVIPGQRINYSLNFPDMNMTVSGILTVAPEGDNTRVNWVNEGELGGNPLYHYFSLFADRALGPDFEAGLSNLKSLIESNK